MDNDSGYMIRLVLGIPQLNDSDFGKIFRQFLAILYNIDRNLATCLG